METFTDSAVISPISDSDSPHFGKALKRAAVAYMEGVYGSFVQSQSRGHRNAILKRIGEINRNIRKHPESIFFPTEMFDSIASQLHICMYPLTMDTTGTVTLQTSDTCVEHSSQKPLYLCTQASRTIPVSDPVRKTRHGAIMKKTNGGLLMLVSW